ncbi:MAG: hypothetical protein ACK5KP_11130 [Paludibacteraceae bacterium]
MSELKVLSKENQFADNPRKISSSQLEQLTNHLKKYGDLSGVIYCRNNKAFVGGNQRSKVFNGSKITITENYNTPLSDKTVAIGFIEWTGRKYFYREVEFTKEEFREACIAANNDGGKWDNNVFKEFWSKEELSIFGFDMTELENIFPTDLEDELNISSDDFEQTSALDYLKFSTYRIPLTDEELNLLNNELSNYFELNGTVVGFAKYLVENE